MVEEKQTKMIQKQWLLKVQVEVGAELRLGISHPSFHPFLCF
jgi:hypothetical protein